MIAEIIEAPISSPEQYDQIPRAATGTDGMPPGAVVHVAGLAQGGGWRIVTVWESSEAASRFAARIHAALATLRLEGEARVTRFEVHNLQPSA